MKTLLRNSVVAALALSVCGLFAADGKAASAQPQVKTAEKAQKGDKLDSVPARVPARHSGQFHDFNRLRSEARHSRHRRQGAGERR